jgi:glycosyltransferase involved in cell wall biosynthesis
VHYPDVFGDFPFPMLGRLENPYVTMINPCPWKGSSIFKALAKRRPDVRFAAVPTWGATPALMEELKTFSNVTLLKESTDIDEIFSVTKVLLAPSLCQEAFGLVSPEAMLRGIPVIASDIAALKESTLSAARLIPVNPLPFDRPPQGTDPSTFVWKEPENAVEPWCKALDQLLNDAAEYEKDSLGGKKAAEEFVRSLSDRSIVELLTWP